MTTQTGAADERERLIAAMEIASTIASGKYPHERIFMNTADMLRADAETMAATNKLAASMCVKYAAACEQLAAQSAELERVRKDAERYRYIRNHPWRKFNAMTNELDHAVDGCIAVDRLSALAIPSAAGGEKEG